PRSAAGVTNRFIGEKDQVCNFFILMDTINDVYSHAPGNLPPSPSPPSTRLREGRARNRGHVQRLLGWWRRRQKIAWTFDATLRDIMARAGRLVGGSRD